MQRKKQVEGCWLEEVASSWLVSPGAKKQGEGAGQPQNCMLHICADVVGAGFAIWRRLHLSNFNQEFGFGCWKSIVHVFLLSYLYGSVNIHIYFEVHNMYTVNICTTICG